MKALRKALIGAILLSASCSWAASTASFLATPEDADLKSLVTRWAAMEGKKMIWQTEVNAPLKSPDLLNDEARLHRNLDFPQAFEALNSLVRKASHEDEGEGPSTLAPLFACVFTNAIVVRDVFQAPCSNPDPNAKH